MYIKIYIMNTLLILICVFIYLFYFIFSLKQLVGLVIGKKGETIRLLAEQTGCKVFVDQTEIPGTNQKNVNITGKNYYNQIIN